MKIAGRTPVVKGEFLLVGRGDEIVAEGVGREQTVA